MRLKTRFENEDFRLGEVVDARFLDFCDHDESEIVLKVEAKSGGIYTFYYSTIKEFADNWEDYEEPKGSALDLMVLTLTNFIENEPDEDKADLEDCKQMLGKLKAWKRLEDKGFRFNGWEDSPSEDDFDMIWFTMKAKVWDVETQEDLDICFGGEE